MASVKLAIAENVAPLDLAHFWSGKLKYGFSGSMVKFIDMKYGRAILTELLKYSDLGGLLDSLETTQKTL